MNPHSTDSDGVSWQVRPPTAGDGTTVRFIHALSHGADPPDGCAVQRFHPLPPIAVTAAERGFDVDQTNHSVVVDEQVVVKWLLPPVPLPHPTPEIFAHLTAVGFTETALPYAALSRRVPGGPDMLVALVTAYLPGATDGWEWCLPEAVAGRTDFAADLGRLAADLHTAMATPSPALPDPIRLSWQGREWATRARDALDEALDLTEGDDGAWLAGHAATLRHELSALELSGTAAATPLIRIHSDLHVGQLLRWRGGYAVIDFDGNPTVRAADPYQPAARDLAQLATSLEHVAQVAIRRKDTDPGRSLAWAAAARDTLRRAYRDRLASRGMSTLLEESLLGPLEIEQECRELIYAARHLPRWRYAPMGVLRSRYPAVPASPAAKETT